MNVPTIKSEYTTPIQTSAHTQFTPEEHKRITQLLERKLGGDEISTRPGAGGNKISYVTGNKVIELANYIFSYNGWYSSVNSIDEDYCVTENGRTKCGYTAIVRITLKDGSYHEDIGYGASINQSDRGAAIEKAKKEAVTDAMKRALRLYGNGLGLTIYDKQYLDDIRTGKIHSEALDLTRHDAVTTEELNEFHRAQKRVKTEPVYDASYDSSHTMQNNSTTTSPHQVAYNTTNTYKPATSSAVNQTSTNTYKPIVQTHTAPTNTTNTSTTSTYTPGANIYRPSTTAQQVQPPTFIPQQPLTNTTNTYNTTKSTTYTHNNQSQSRNQTKPNVQRTTAQQNEQMPPLQSASQEMDALMMQIPVIQAEPMG